MNLVEKIIKKTKTYKDLETLMDSSNQESFKKQRKILKLENALENANYKLIKLEGEKKGLIINGQKVVEEKVATIKSLEKCILELKNKVAAKEKARRKLAGKIGGFQARINKLESQVEFLKTNRRAPKLEEIKDYEYKRKRSVDKNV